MRNIVLRQRARQAALNALRFAERLRKRNSEFAPSYRETLESVGDELAILSRDTCRDERERRAVLAGLMTALQRMYRSDPQLAQRVTRRLAPRILAGEPTQTESNPWVKLAV
ncbi:MAG TPA: hypothetical protein VET48_10980 [Steroidobacteraceae bacterium]|nr:hypothetical protein [Steroidobacteraceae bacterium]